MKASIESNKYHPNPSRGLSKENRSGGGEAVNLQPSANFGVIQYSTVRCLIKIKEVYL